MQAFFIVCFGVGAGYAVLSFFLGEIIGLFDFDTEFDFIGDGVSPLKPSVVAAFLTVFGGCGFLLIRRADVLTAVAMAFLAAMAVAYLMYRYIILPLHRAQNTSAVEKQSLIGHDAAVTESIPQGRFGKITYYVNGNTYSAPAKTEDGGELARGAAVEIVSIERNTYYVRRKLMKEG